MNMDELYRRLNQLETAGDTKGIEKLLEENPKFRADLLDTNTLNAYARALQQGDVEEANRLYVENSRLQLDFDAAHNTEQVTRIDRSLPKLEGIFFAGLVDDGYLIGQEVCDILARQGVACGYDTLAACVEEPLQEIPGKLSFNPRNPEAFHPRLKNVLDKLVEEGYVEQIGTCYEAGPSARYV